MDPNFDFSLWENGSADVGEGGGEQTDRSHLIGDNAFSLSPSPFIGMGSKQKWTQNDCFVSGKNAKNGIQLLIGLELLWKAMEVPETNSEMAQKLIGTVHGLGLGSQVVF